MAFKGDQPRGYRGKVTLVSPDGSQRITLNVPGRQKVSWNNPIQGFSSLALDSRYHYWNHGEEGERLDRRFRQLLSRGWKVISSDGNAFAQSEEKKKEAQDGQKGEKKESQKPVQQKESEEVKEVVEAISEISEDVHGGSEATKDIPDSPNPADEGQQDNLGAESGQDGEQGGGHHGRGNRGGRPESRRRERRTKHQQLRLKVQKSAQIGGVGVYSPQPLRVSAKAIKSAEESAQLLAELVGRSSQKTVQGIEVNAEALLVALETGDNPLPPLEEPRERPRLRVLLTPDSSGSTQNWSGLGRAWALHLAKNPDIDVVYKDNFNGEFWNEGQDPTEETRKLIAEVDVVIYLGDGDGYNLCHRYAEQGATVVALDCYSASVANPRLRETHRKAGGGVLYWVDRVSAKEPDTWAKALRLVLQN